VQEFKKKQKITQRLAEEEKRKRGGIATFDRKSPPLESKGGAPSSSMGGGVTRRPQDPGTKPVPGALGSDPDKDARRA